jgi:stage V sporulation protein B
LYKLHVASAEINLTVESNYAILKKLLNIAIPVTLSSTILSLTKIIDMTMLLRRLNDIGYTQEQSNSIYGAYSTMAVSIYNLPATLISAIALPLVPLLVSAIENGDAEKEKRVVSSSVKMASIVAIPTGLGISVFSDPILKMLFSSQKEEIGYVAPLLSLLGFSVFLSAMITVTNAILQAYKQAKKPIISMTVGVVLKIVFAYLLIGNSKINIYGAPLSTFVSSLAIVAINLYFVIKETGRIDTVFDLFGKPFISALVSIIIGAAFYVAISQMIISKILVLPVIAFVAVIYGIMILKLRVVGKNEILMLPHGEDIFKILKKIHLV